MKTWQITPEDQQALQIIFRDGEKCLSDLVREIYGIDTGKDGKELVDDKLKKINMFKNHLKKLCDDGFLQTRISKTERSRHKVTVYFMPSEIIIGKGILLILNDAGIDVTQLRQVMKYAKPDGESFILPLSL